MDRKELIIHKKRELLFPKNRILAKQFLAKLGFHNISSEAFIGINNTQRIINSIQSKKLRKAKVYSEWMGSEKFFDIIENIQLPSSEEGYFLYQSEYDTGLITIDTNDVLRFLKHLSHFDKTYDFDVSFSTVSRDFCIELSFYDHNIPNDDINFQIEVYGCLPEGL